MIQVVVRPTRNRGVFTWSVSGAAVASGRSRMPLFDCCRVLKSMGVNPLSEIGMFHRQDNGEISAWSLKTTVGKGASLIVRERPGGGRPTFAKYEPYDENNELNHE